MKLNWRTTRSILRQRIFFSICIAGLTVFVSGEMTNLSEYGNCGVYDSVDDFTDEVTFVFQCESDKSKVIGTKAAVGLLLYPSGNWMLVVKTGDIVFHIEETIPVVIRVDKNDIFTWNNAMWNSEGDSGVIFPSDEDRTRLLTELSHGKKLAIKVGKDRASIELTGVTEAIEEFAQRVSLNLDSNELPEQGAEPAQESSS